MNNLVYFIVKLTRATLIVTATDAFGTGPYTV